MTVKEQMDRFSERYRKQIEVQGMDWRYYRLGIGEPIMWLTGGLRRAAFGFAFMERLAARHTVIAPDYSPARTIDAFIAAFDAILGAESVNTFALGGQSYGGLLAQAFLACRPGAVRCLVLSSTGPADYGRAWQLVDEVFIGLARVLPEKMVKNLLAGGLLKAMAVPEQERAEWAEAVNAVMNDDLTRGDVISHFAVAGDLIRKGFVSPGALRDWKGRIVVLSAENDPTQSPKDFPRYERLFGRAVEKVDMGSMGHTAALSNPDKYVELLERALV